MLLILAILTPVVILRAEGISRDDLESLFGVKDIEGAPIMFFLLSAKIDNYDDAFATAKILSLFFFHVERLVSILARVRLRRRYSFCFLFSKESNSR